MSRSTTIFLVVAALAVALATLVDSPDAKRTPTLDVVNRDGEVVISNSKEGCRSSRSRTRRRATRRRAK